MGHKDTGVKILMLEIEDYIHWKVKMLLYPLSFDIFLYSLHRERSSCANENCHGCES